VMDGRKLLVLAAFFWATPLAAHGPSGAGDRAKAPAQTRCAKPVAHDTGCSRGRRAKGYIGGVSFPPAEYPPSEVFLFDTGRRPPKHFP
jgi:hypothetical protein